MKTLKSDLNPHQSKGFTEITHGIDIDCELYAEEIEVQKAWAQGLASAGFLSEQELNLFIQTISDLREEMQTGKFQWNQLDEDIHMSIERHITERIGEIGKKIHLGRSRNDLVATTLKLYTSNKSDELSRLSACLCQTIMTLSEKYMEVIVPAFTHSQAAQPVRLAHLFNFHALNFLSDVQRFSRCQLDLLEVMPLGSGAVSGTHLNVDLNKIAIQLKFRTPNINSIHGVSDRDALIDFSQAISMLGLHISKLCDDIIYFSSTPVGLIILPEAWSSGSSMMPNKRNPDFFEIVRAKAKRLVALSHQVMVINMGFISGYSSDLHEQKRVIIEAIKEVERILTSINDAIAALKVSEARAQKLLDQGHILATDIANELVCQGMNFRNAYQEVARLVVAAEEKFTQVGRPEMSFESSVETRNNFGGTSKFRVQQCIEHVRYALG